MDIQELKQFESVYQPSKEVTFCWGVKKYVQLSTEENHTEIVDHANDSLRIWQAAKAQAVLEKDAVIKKLSDQLYAQEMKASAARVLCETACELLDGYAHQDAMVILNDLEQAMKEPAND